MISTPMATNKSLDVVAFHSNSSEEGENQIGDANMIILCLLVVLSCLIISANLFVITLVYRTSYLKTITNYCLTFLAASDLLSGMVAVPMVITCNAVRSRATCIAMDLSSRFISTSTIMHLLLVTMERYIMIVFPMKYPQVVTKRRMRGILLGLWGFSLAVTLVQLFWIQFEENVQENADVAKIEVIYSLVGVFGIVAIPLLVMAFVYGHIFLVLSKQVKKIVLQLPHLRKISKRRRVQLKAVRVFGIMILGFVLGWVPYFLSAALNDLKIGSRVPFEVDITFFFLRYLTSLVNPIIYTIFKEDFKKAIRSLVCRKQQNAVLLTELEMT